MTMPDSQKNKNNSIQTSIEPWLTFRNCEKAIAFYKNAFNAIETYRFETPDGGLVVNLSINGANFWLSSGADNSSHEQESVGANTIRLILTIQDPDPIFQQALKAGASEIFPIGEDYGWKLGRLVDPFGLHWEIGHPLTAG
jgi:PhnB protein